MVRRRHSNYGCHEDAGGPSPGTRANRRGHLDPGALSSGPGSPSRAPARVDERAQAPGPSARQQKQQGKGVVRGSLTVCRDQLRKRYGGSSLRGA